LPDYSTFLRSCSRSRREVSSCPTRRSSDLGRERERYLFGKFSLRGSSVKVWDTTDEYTQRVLNIPRLFKLARPIVKAGSKLLPLPHIPELGEEIKVWQLFDLVLEDTADLDPLQDRV